jgi:hypothetical protein
MILPNGKPIPRGELENFDKLTKTMKMADFIAPYWSNSSLSSFKRSY